MKDYSPNVSPIAYNAKLDSTTRKHGIISCLKLDKYSDKNYLDKIAKEANKSCPLSPLSYHPQKEKLEE